MTVARAGLSEPNDSLNTITAKLSSRSAAWCSYRHEQLLHRPQQARREASQRLKRSMATGHQLAIWRAAAPGRRTPWPLAGTAPPPRRPRLVPAGRTSRSRPPAAARPTLAARIPCPPFQKNSPPRPCPRRAGPGPCASEPASWRCWSGCRPAGQYNPIPANHAIATRADPSHAPSWTLRWLSPLCSAFPATFLPAAVGPGLFSPTRSSTA